MGLRLAVVECGGGLADGFGVAVGFGALAGDVFECGGGGVAGFVVDEVFALGAHVLESGFEVGELLAVRDGDELGEGEVVVVAELERGDRGVQQVVHEGVGEGGGVRVGLPGVR
ncbi:MAG: hypothetical protein ACX94C_05920 [Phycisphaerales bacterium]